MSPHASSSLFAQDIVVEQQDSAAPPYAQSGAYVGGGVRQELRQSRARVRSIPERQHPAHSHARNSHSHASTMKRGASDDSNGTPAKHIKIEQPEEFSNAVKKRLQLSSRTGQACDRCKVSAYHPRPPGIRRRGRRQLTVSADSEDPMRWASRRMFAMLADQ